MELARNEVDERIVGGRPAPPYEATSRLLTAQLRTEELLSQVVGLLTEIRDALARSAPVADTPPPTKATKPPKAG